MMLYLYIKYFLALLIIDMETLQQTRITILQSADVNKLSVTKAAPLQNNGEMRMPIPTLL